MRLGTLETLREALGRNVDGSYSVGLTLASAIKKGAGMTARKFDVDAVVAWKKKNPNFTIGDAFPRQRQRTRANPSGATADKSCEPS